MPFGAIRACSYSGSPGPTGGKAWLFRFAINGRARQMGLGAVADVSLGEERERFLKSIGA